MKTQVTTQNLLEIQDLIEWLAEKGILDKYLYNVMAARLRADNSLNTSNAFCKDIPISNIIAESFDWGSTKDGYTYWSKISFEWEKFVTEKQLSGIYVDDFMSE